VNYRRLLTFVLALLPAIGLVHPRVFAQEKPVQSIKFSGVTYRLAWQSQPDAQYSKYEYLPAKEKLPYYQSMMMLELLKNGMTPADAARAQVQFLNERKQTDPTVNHRLINNAQTGEYLLDFVLSAEDPKVGQIVEWNAYRYIPYRSADGRSGVQLFGYSARAYGAEDGRKFLMALKNKRPRIIDALVAAKAP